MSYGGAIRFIRKGGRVIPIKTMTAGGQKAAESVKIKKGVEASREMKRSPIKAHAGLKTASFGLAVASGILGAATFAGGTKAFLGGTALGLGLDAVSTSLNIAAHAGKGHAGHRIKAAAKSEAINQSVGWGIFGAGLIGMKRNRVLISQGTKSLLTKIIRRAT